MSNAERFIVVVGLDYSELAIRGVDQALEVAGLRPGSEVHVVYAEQDIWVGAAAATLLQSAVGTRTAGEQLHQFVLGRVARMSPSIEVSHLRRVVAHVRRGSPAEAIVQLAADLDADLVVVGSHGQRGVEHQFLGSVAERVARIARCPVWLVRPRNHSAGPRLADIQAPCPECTATRNSTSGARYYCAKHEDTSAHTFRNVHTTEGVYDADTFTNGS